MKKIPRSVAIVCIVTATLLAYWPALRNGFVWDDTALCLRDPLIRSWRLIPEGFRHFLFLDATASDFYRPLQRLTFTLDYQLYSFENPWGWHLTSILLHAAASVALWVFLRKLLSTAPANPLPEPFRDRLTLGVTLIWAIHPLHTSAVTYIAGRADPLAALFGFSALSLALLSLENRPASRWLSLAASTCFLAALLSKEAGIFALLLWLLLLAFRRSPLRISLRWLAITACILATYSTLRFTAEKFPPPSSPPTPLAIRPILAARALAEYAALTVAPLHLHMERDVSSAPKNSPAATLHHARLREFQTLAGVLLALGLALWTVRGSRHHPLIPFALAAFILAYLPISNLFSLNATVAEHWLYLPSAWIFFAAALSLAKCSLPIRPILALLTLWFLALATQTFRRQADWLNQRSLFESTIANGGDSPRMRMNLANLEASEHHDDLALAHYRNALQRSPHQAIIWLGYAKLLLQLNLFPQAEAALQEAQKSPWLTPDCLEFQAALRSRQHHEDRSDLLLQALALTPNRWSIRKRYADYLASQGKPELALAQLRFALEIAPYRGSTWRELASLLETLHRPDLARLAFIEAANRDVHDSHSRQQIARLHPPLPPPTETRHP